MSSPSHDDDSSELKRGPLKVSVFYLMTLAVADAVLAASGYRTINEE